MKHLTTSKLCLGELPPFLVEDLENCIYTRKITDGRTFEIIPIQRKWGVWIVDEDGHKTVGKKISILAVYPRGSGAWIKGTYIVKIVPQTIKFGAFQRIYEIAEAVEMVFRDDIVWDTWIIFGDSYRRTLTKEKSK